MSTQGSSVQTANMYSSQEGYPSSQEQVNVMNGYNPRMRNDPYSNTYNPGWKNHPNFAWKNNEGQPQGQMFNKPTEEPKDERIDQLLQAFQQHATTSSSAIRKLEIQIGQLAEAQQKPEPGKFPSQPEQAKAMMNMRSGKLLDTGSHGDKKVVNTEEEIRKRKEKE
ncbi:hypothetical protein LIER_26695 [Lithospermum erythrorhizon]|uniref:Uncharacterized protein n=1 Tax=Lithospermum erythrorhizon TaxID=34254 RepID=A0AAV3RCB6_LITER